MTNMEKLLSKLLKAKLKSLKSSDIEQYLYDIDDKEKWKNRKQNSIVNQFYLVKYELWQDRLIKRVFYVNQKWYCKQKEYCNIYEVQRFLAGHNKKLNRWIYQGSFGGVKICYWKNYEDSEWEIGNLKTTICENQTAYYSNSIPVYYYNGYHKFLKDSIHKYSAFDESGLKESELFWYLYQYEKHPQMEMIVKMGLIDVVIGSMSCLRWSQKGYKLLGLENKNELEQVRLCYRYGGLKYYRKHKDDLRKYQIDNELKLSVYDILMNRKFPYISKKVIEYIVSIRFGNTHFPRLLTNDYIDYIEFCNQLGIPITSAIKYPKNFKTEHDRLQDLIKINASKAENEKILNQVLEKLFRYRFADEEFVITPANSTKDLINESKELYHCVKTYAKRYAAGNTAIFLIRKRDDVLRPYYTLELKNNKINQVRGKHNCDPTDNVKKFVLKWAKKFKIDTKIYQQY